MGWRFCTLKTVPNLIRDGFDCGDRDINNFLRDRVEAFEGELSRTFFMVPETEEPRVAGYYTLSASTVPIKELPEQYREGISFPVPAVLIGQFAIDRSCQGQGLSRKLLGDAYRRICLLYNQGIIGFKAIRVDTRKPEAKEFWLKQGFIEFHKTKRCLFLPVKTILRELEA